MKLGIIGSGNIGGSIGKWASKFGYEVTFSARNIKHAEEAAKEAGNNSKYGNSHNAVSSADLVLLAVPYTAVKDVLKEIGPELRGKILIDATNPLNQDYSGLSIGFTTSAAEEIQKMVPEAKVVKAFNSVFSSIYESQHSELSGKKIAVFYAGDDSSAKAKTAELITKLGFEAVDAGGLQSARTIEPLAMLNITLGYAQGHGTNIGFSFLH